MRNTNYRGVSMERATGRTNASGLPTFEQSTNTTTEGERMNIHEYNVINADGQQIRKIATGKKDQAIASAKLAALYGSKAVFLRLEYAGTKTA